MKILNKKIYRDVKLNLSQFITIFLMVFLAIFVFAGIHAYMDGMQVSGDNFYEQNNLQDIWLTGENFSKEDLEKVKETANVKDAERQLTITTTLDGFDDVTLETNFIESNNISKMYIVDGEEFDKEKSGVWLDSYLAKNLDLKVGDEITFTYQTYKITEKIVGLVNTPDHVYSIKSDNEIFPTHENYGYIYLSINEFPEDYDVFNSIIVDVEDTTKINETKSDLENNIESALAVTDRESSVSYSGYNSEIEEGTTFSGVFTILFLFIAILSVITTMNRFVRKQRMQIGTLKALGIKRKRIIRHYVSYGFWISLIASISGLIIGELTLGKFFLNMEMGYFEIPTYDTVLLPIVYIVAMAVVVIITFVTYLSCKKVLKEPASEALRLEIPKVKKTKFDLTTKGILKKASFSTKWNLRDMARNKARTSMAIVGIVGCTMLIVCAFGLLDSMNAYLDWEFDEICNFEYKLALESNYTNEEFNNLTSKYGNSTSQTLGIEIKNKDTKETNIITVNDSNNKLRYTDHNKDYIELNSDGVYITEKLSKTLNLNVGDEITWHIFGDDNWYTTKIVGLNRDPQSQQLNMTREYYESLGLTYHADSIYTDENLRGTKELDGVETIQSIDSLKSGMQSMLGTMKTVVVLLIIVSVILGFVIIYNLGILSFTEKQYQFATLKVLGFKDNQIKKIFIKQNTWITVIAIVLGLPLGFFMTDFIFKSALGDSYDFNAEIKIISYMYAIIGTLIVSFVVNKVLAKKVKTIDMVTSLKGNE
ncbi:MAG: ABC transporter permease [Clostridia bacterium]|nr:ABC transporter permease [Clostridia bacterium]